MSGRGPAVDDTVRVVGRLQSALPVRLTKEGRELHRYYLVDENEGQLVMDLTPSEAAEFQAHQPRRGDTVVTERGASGFQAEVLERAEFGNLEKVSAAALNTLHELQAQMTELHERMLDTLDEIRAHLLEGATRRDDQGERGGGRGTGGMPAGGGDDDDQNPSWLRDEPLASGLELALVKRGFAHLQVPQALQDALLYALTGERALMALNSKQAGRVVNYLAKVARGEMKLRDVIEKGI